MHIFGFEIKRVKKWPRYCSVCGGRGCIWDRERDGTPLEVCQTCYYCNGFGVEPGDPILPISRSGT